MPTNAVKTCLLQANCTCNLMWSLCFHEAFFQRPDDAGFRNGSSFWADLAVTAAQPALVHQEFVWGNSSNQTVTYPLIIIIIAKEF